QAEDGIRDFHVTGVQTCALPIAACSIGVRGTSASQGGRCSYRDEASASAVRPPPVGAPPERRTARRKCGLEGRPQAVCGTGVKGTPASQRGRCTYGNEAPASAVHTLPVGAPPDRRTGRRKCGLEGSAQAVFSIGVKGTSGSQRGRCPYGNEASASAVHPFPVGAPPRCESGLEGKYQRYQQDRK